MKMFIVDAFTDSNFKGNPAAGIDEDPVTGSAHCSLAPYRETIIGKKDLVGFQASQRGGIVKCRWQEDRVHLSGEAKTFLTGKIELNELF